MTKEKNNIYYYQYPIHIDSYEINNESIVISIINKDNLKIDEIKITSNGNQMVFNQLSNDTILKLEIPKLSYSNLFTKPEITSTIVEGKEYKLKDYKDYVYIQKAKSIYFLGIERYLYRDKMATNIGCNKKDVKFIAQDYGYYWNCICGNSNLSIYDECQECHNKKNILFSKSVEVGEESHNTENLKKININFMIWIFVLYSINLIIQMFGGDLFFYNDVKNNFYGIVNRFIVPLIIFLSSLGMIIAANKYKKNIIIFLDILRLISIVYLNTVSAMFSILTAYNFLLLLLLNILFLIHFIKQYFHSMNKVYHYIFSFISLVLFVFATIQIIEYSKYDLEIYKDGLYLKVETDEEKYVIPEEINKIKVYKVYFNISYDYKIKELYIGNNLKELNIYSTIVLPSLEKINVESNNNSFEVKDNLLYYKNGPLKLVPNTTKEITINDENIQSRALMDNIYLEKVIIGKDVKTIGRNAFANCISLNSIEFAKDGKLEFIDDYAFANNTSLESINFPITLKKMGIGVLKNSSSLNSLTIPFIGEKREDSDDITNSTDIFTYIFGSKTYLDSDIIPSSLKYVRIYDVNKIHNVTFFNNKHIEKIYFDKLSSMGIRSFYGCKSLTDFEIPNGVTIIKESSFENCENLKEIIIPATVINIEKNAFKNANLEDVKYLGNIDDLEIETLGNEKLIELLKK